jgi:hypothetical protein
MRGLKMREKIIYKARYRRGERRLTVNSLPKLNHINDGFDVVEAHLEEVGIVSRGKEELEYNIIRVYLKQTKEEPAYERD